MKPPKPRMTQDMMCLIQQCNVTIDYAEKQGDLRLMIRAMAERAELFQQAVKESIQWYQQSLTTADK